MEKLKKSALHLEIFINLRDVNSHNPIYCLTFLREILY